MQYSDRQAIDFVGAYTGTFGFLQSIRDQVRAGRRLSAAQIAAVKNCMRRAGYVPQAATTRAAVSYGRPAASVNRSWAFGADGFDTAAEGIAELDAARVRVARHVARGPRSKAEAIQARRDATQFSTNALLVQGVAPEQVPPARERAVKPWLIEDPQTENEAFWNSLCEGR